MSKSNVSRSGGVKKINTIYLDHASSALLNSANPGGIHEFSLKEKNKLEKARKIIAEILGARNYEIVFTSGATESNNLAIFGLINNFKKPHIITTNIEHASVLEVCRHLEETKKAEVTYVEVEENGIVDPKKIKKALKKNTVLVSVMYANNEFGTIEPVKDIVKVAVRARKENQLRYPLVHTDACQAAQFLDIASSRLNIDFLTISGAKFYGPKGVGVLYVRRGGSVTPVIPGEQEQGRRGGTEWGAGIVAAATAFALARDASEKEEKRLRKLSGALTADLMRRVPGVIINGHPTDRVPHIVNFSVPGMAHDYLALALDAEGFAVSTGSACTGTLGADSRVILALKKQGVHGGIRVSLGSDTTAQSLKEFVSALGRILARMEPYADVSDI